MSDCGPRPVQSDYLNDYDRPDLAAYQADLAAWIACNQAAGVPTPFIPPTVIPLSVQQAAGIIPPTQPVQAVTTPAGGDGAIADQALAWLPANLPGGQSNSIYQSWRAQIVAALGVGILDPGGQYATRTGKCSGSTPPQSATGVQIGQTALSIAGTGATTGLSIAGVVGAPIPIVGAGIAAASILVSLFSKLFGPPTSALEQKYLCPLVSAANAVLLQIVSEVNAGQLSAAQAGAAFDSLYTSFHQQLITPVALGGSSTQQNELLYYNTPNDSQFMDSSLVALGIKYKQTWYPMLEAAANANKAAQAAAAAAAQQAAATALQNQINADVAKAVAASNIPAMQPTTPMASTVGSMATQVPAPSAPSGVVYAVIGAVAAAIILLLFL